MFMVWFQCCFWLIQIWLVWLRYEKISRKTISKKDLYKTKHMTTIWRNQFKEKILFNRIEARDAFAVPTLRYAVARRLQYIISHARKQPQQQTLRRKRIRNATRQKQPTQSKLNEETLVWGKINAQRHVREPTRLRTRVVSYLALAACMHTHGVVWVWLSETTHACTCVV